MFLESQGFLAASLFHMGLIVDDVAEWRAKSQVVAVFDTNVGHVTLHDAAYSADCGITTGNPYKGLVADRIKREVEVEVCGATAKVHNYGNEDLLPIIKIKYPRDGANNGARSERFCEDQRVVEQRAARIIRGE